MSGEKRLILLTGATGYIGGRLLKVLEQRRVRLRCLARSPEFHLAEARTGHTDPLLHPIRHTSGDRRGQIHPGIVKGGGLEVRVRSRRSIPRCTGKQRYVRNEQGGRATPCQLTRPRVRQFVGRMLAWIRPMFATIHGNRYDFRAGGP